MLDCGHDYKVQYRDLFAAWLLSAQLLRLHANAQEY